MRRRLRYLLHQARFLTPILAIVFSMLPAPGSSPVADAAVATGPAFGSAVACLNGAPNFAVSRHEDTMFANPTPGSYAGIQTLTPGGTPITQAYLDRIGSVYSLAYDDGAASGKERLFAAAYTRRMVEYGFLGAGGIYVFERSGSGWVLNESASFTVPGVVGVTHSVGFSAPYDSAAIAGVGSTSLGGMAVSPDGKQLYVVNIGANSVARFNLTASGKPTYDTSFGINYGVLSSDAAAQADMRPFALEWYAYGDGNNRPYLLVGVIDTARRELLWGKPTEELDPRTNGGPRAYVAMLTTGTGAWQRALDLDLNSATFSGRLNGSAFLWELSAAERARVDGWNPWRNDLKSTPRLSREMRYPQPILTNIELVRETAPTAGDPTPSPMMVLGFRDRTGDLAFNDALDVPPGEYTAIAQGDVVGLRLVGGAWTVVSTDHFADDALPNAADQTKHRENFSGAIARIPGLGTSVSTAGDTLVTLGLAGNRTSGFYTWWDNARNGGAPAYTNTLAASGTHSATKATNLGDVETLCSYTLVGGRVWSDTNGNGVQEAADTSIPGVVVEAFQGADAVNGLARAAASTDASGRYLLALPPNTNYNIRISAASRATLLRQGYLQYTLPRATGNPRATNDSNIDNILGYIEFAQPGQGVSSVTNTPLWRSYDARSYDIGVTRVQPTGVIGNRVWNDVNRDGLQTTGERGVANVLVSLESAGASLASVNTSIPTDGNGNYAFNSLAPGRYRVRFTVPSGYQVSPKDRGSNDALDSDADAASGYYTAYFNLGANQTQNQWDFGVIGGADVWVTKSASATTAPVGGQYTYTLSYGNRTGQATSVVINDTLPAGLLFVSAAPAPTTRAGQALSWSIGTLNTGQNGSVQITVRAPTALTPSTAVQQVVQNCASITMAVMDLTPADNSSCVNTTLQRPEVRITKAAPATALIGDEFNYTLSYGNSGTAPASNVAIRDTLPTGLQFVRWVSNPGSVCTISSGVVSCGLGALAAGASGQVVFTVRANLATMPGTGTVQVSRNTAVIGPGPDPTSSTPWPGDTPGNNSSSTDTSIQFPDPSIGIFINPAPASADPEKLPVGEWGSIDVTYGNNGSGVARSSSLTITYGAGATIGALPSIPGSGACTANAALRRITCPLGNLPASSPAIRTVRLPIRLPAAPADPATFGGDSYGVSGGITTSTPERVTHQANNSASDTTQVIRPNPRVFVDGPPAEEVVRMTWGSAYYYTVRYDNLYVARPYLTRAAANTVLRVVLPDEVELLSASVAPATQNGQELTWNLGTLASQQAGSIRLAVRTDVPVHTSLHLDAYISTTTPGDDLSDNHDETDVEIVPPPPAYPSLASALQLAIHSELDPRHGGANDRDGVYYAEGDTIAWPAGEVLDFSPRLNSFEMDPAPFPLEYRARVRRWRIVGYEVNGRSYSAPGADSRGITGCRQGGSALTGVDGQTTCAYPYIGAHTSGRSVEDFLPTLMLREPEMASQGHVYWTKPVAPPMRNDVYLFTVDPMEAVALTVAVDVEVWTVNACPDINIEPYVCGAPIEEPQPPREERSTEQTFSVKLLVPRSVVGPGGVNP